MYNISQIIASLQFVPRIANTHYYYQTYGNPAIVPSQKTSDVKGAPQIKTSQKKLRCDKNEFAAAHAAPASAPMPHPAAPVARPKYRKNVDKRALAEYFDNLTDHVEQSDKAKESAQWLADVTAELDRKDAVRRAAQTAEQEKLREFVETLKAPAAHYIIVVMIDFAPLANTMSAREEINANILDKFERRMQRVSQARGMKKMHDIHKLRQNQK